METVISNSQSHQKKPSVVPTFVKEEKRSDVNASKFDNQAAGTWHEMRREWVGDQSKKQLTVPKDPVISWSMTYEDLLSTCEPFPQTIPLTEMVDFLVDIWHDDGLYD